MSGAAFDRVLVGYYSDAPDGMLVGGYIADQTERLGLLIAHRPGFVAPTLAARAFATLDQLSNGRVAIHVISGGDDADQRRDGDYLDKDARYARTDEYVEILKAIWTGDAPVSHAGAHYRFEAASPAVRSVQRPRIPIYFGGASEAAVRAAAKHADVFALWGETLCPGDRDHRTGARSRGGAGDARCASASRCARSWPTPKTRPGPAPNGFAKPSSRSADRPGWVRTRGSRRMKARAACWRPRPRATGWTSGSGRALRR